MSEHTSIHGQWSSRLMFILAASGSAIGLGNIWKFPYITGENGGGAFVLVYLVCIAIVGIPIMIAEVMIGRRGRQSPINTLRTLAQQEGASPSWALLGWMGMIAGIIILSYYSVIAGWVLAYLFRSVGGVFTGATADGVKSIFSGLVADPERLITWHTLFMAMTMAVVARGVHHGLEQAVRWMMPALILLVLLLVGYASQQSGFQKGLEFLFTPDFDKLFYQCDVLDGVAQNCKFSSKPLLVALGHSFFTLSLGMGAIMVYGSYMPKGSSIGFSVLTIAFLDTLIALLAGMAIFPLVFTNGLEPGAGPGLIFQTLPLAFGSMPGGRLFGSLFFLMVLFAAWTSSISLMEPAVAWLMEHKAISRVRSTLYLGGGTWLLGLATVFSFNLWSGKAFKFHDMTAFDLLDYLAANIMLPIGGLLIAVFGGWVMSRRSSVEELALGDGVRYWLWRVVIRYITPFAVVLLFLRAIGVIGVT